MTFFVKFFAALTIWILAFSNAEATTFQDTEFQELRTRIIMPILPDRIRKRNPPPRLPRRMPPQFSIPHKVQPKPIYTQKHPKRPPHIYIPRRPAPSRNQRGSERARTFGPPKDTTRR